MDELALARALHVLAIVHWIGGVALVTLVILPGLIARVAPAERLVLFEEIEGRFALQARISTLLAGASGFYMLHVYGMWPRLLSIGSWWLIAMIVIWAVFTFVLFLAEPLFLHRWFMKRAQTDPEGTFRLVLRMHRVLLTLSLATVAAGVLGAHAGLS